MSQYFFGLGRGRPSKRKERKINKIAEKHDAYFIVYDDPAQGWRYWFATRNYGEPFNGATRDAVASDLWKAGFDIEDLTI